MLVWGNFNQTSTVERKTEGYGMNQEIYNENEQALKEILLDISCLDQLAEWSDSFNLFDILKIIVADI